MTDLLRVEDLHIAFDTQAGTVEALKGISFRIQAGKTVALVGESGSGKSVCAQAIMGILPRNARITSGRILFDDPERHRDDVLAERMGTVSDLAALSPKSRDYRNLRGNRISMIFQEPMTSLSPLHTVGNQVQETLLIHRGMDTPKAREVAIETLRLVGFPDPERAYDTYPFELSGGLRQRAMIAMALICRPALLIADEPTTALDVTIQAQILKLVKDLQDELGMAVLMITHDLGVVANVADEVVVAYHGRIMEAGTARDLFTAPEHPYLAGLLKAVPHFDMPAGTRLTPLREIKADMTSSPLLAQSSAWQAPEGDTTPILEVKDLRKTFVTRKGKGWFSKSTTTREIHAVNNVSFSIPRGTCLGLVGESGCGKTTLSKMIMGDLAPDAGSITFNNRGTPVDLGSLGEKAYIPLRPRIQYIFQDPFSSLNPRMTVFDIISEPLVIHNIGTPAERRDTVSELMRLVGLDPRHLSRYPHSFSGGQRQRIGIARALALKPDLVICDEPVSALDVSVQAQILNLLKDLQSALGLTYLFISHNLAVVDYIADDIAVMCAGRLVEFAPRESLFKNPRHPYTRALLSAVPTPDLDRPLDFTALMEGKSSDPEAWPKPFGRSGDVEPHLIEWDAGHMVRAHEVTGGQV